MAYNTVDGKYYIGQTRNFTKRRYLHLSSAKNGRSGRFYQALRSYGPESFQWFELDSTDGLTRMAEREAFLIKALRSYDPKCGYNSRRGYDRRCYPNYTATRYIQQAIQRSVIERVASFSMDNSQLEAFLRAARKHGPREHAMFLFAVAHGARASEICNLRIADVNFKSEQVHIARLKGSLDSTQTLLRVKGSSLFNELAALKAWLDVRKPDAQDYVFNSQKSTRLSRVTVFKLFRMIARAAGLPETLQHPHVLKHTAAMLMVRAGASESLIRHHLGYKSWQSFAGYAA